MIRKFAHFAASPETLAALFGAVESWPNWMPGVERVSVVQDGPAGAEGRRLVARIDQRFQGRHFNSLVEIRIDPLRLQQRQLEGLLGRWEVGWSFRPGPDGRGTTLVVEIDYELGMLRFLGARRFFDSRLRDQLETLIENVEQQLAVGTDRREEREGADHATSDGAEHLDDVVLRLFETPRGLEAEYLGRRYRLTPVD